MPDKIFFFVEPHNILDNKFLLNEHESHHLIKVLRKPTGTKIWLTDGVGKVYHGTILSIRNNLVSGQVLEVFPNYGENKIHVSLGIGILKKDKMNFIVEKATECGVNEIIPLILEKSVKRNINIDRLKKISKSAVKQSGRSINPTIPRSNTLDELLNTITNHSIVVCHESGDYGIDIFPKIVTNQFKILLLVGPEGDFSKDWPPGVAER